MKAVVMAGGSGSRLRPLTINRPKPMVPLVNKPVVVHILELLKRHGITDVVLTLQYMAEDIQDYLGDGSTLGMNVQYSVEELPLGTAGSVKQAQALLDDTFIVVSGDAVTDIDLSKVIAFHKAKEAMATIALYRVANPLEYGVVITDDDGRVRQFQEKPSWGEVVSDTVNTGIYVLEPQVLDYFAPETNFDFSKDLFPMLLANDDPMYGYVAEGYWCDVGNIAEYMRASNDMLAGAVQMPALGRSLGAGICCEGEDVEIAPDAQLYGPIYLGQGVKIKGGVIIHGPTVIRDYTVVDAHAHIERSIVWRNCYIGEAAELRGTIVGRQCSLKSKVVAFEGSVIGDSSVIGEGAVIHPGVKIWPNKEIEAGATVKSSLIWGSQGRRVLFGRYGVTGLVNVDLTPEFAAKLGAAFGATLPQGATVTINRDPHRSSRMLKRAAIAGLPSAGVHVMDTQEVPIPVLRYYTRTTDAAGGVHLRISPYDGRVVDIRFLDKQGQDVSTDTARNIERVFFREDFRRVYLDEIGLFSYAPDVRERYSEAFLKAVDQDAIRAGNPNLVIDYANAPTAEILAPLLSALHCRVVALNGEVDESRMSLPSAEFQDSLHQLARIVGALNTVMGVRLDVGGERIFVVDNQGNLVPGTTLAAAMAILTLRGAGGGKIAVPVSAPNVFETIAAANGGQVVRTKANLQSLMQAANAPGIVLAADSNGSFILPELHPVVDGMFATVSLLESLMLQHTTLDQAIAQVPSFHVAQAQVECPWEMKGTVMRRLNEQYKDRLSKQIDGCRIELGKDIWVLVLPDADRPLFHIHAEAGSASEARELAQRYVRIVESLQE